MIFFDIKIRNLFVDFFIKLLINNKSIKNIDIFNKIYIPIKVKEGRNKKPRYKGFNTYY